MPNSIFAGAPTQTPLPHTYQLYLRGPTSEEKEGKERRRERGGQEEKGEIEKERGRDLPDQCETASYAPVMDRI